MKQNIKRDTSKFPVTQKEREAYKKMPEIDTLGQQCWGILNYNVTETTRKRRYDTCSALGSQFKPFASTITPNSTPLSDFLFDEEVMKKMKSELKTVHVNKNSAPSNSKNGQSLGKSSRGYSSGRYNNQKRPFPQQQKKSFNNSHQYNNNQHEYQNQKKQ